MVSQERRFMETNYMRIAADYTTRANYQENYRKSNRDAINARKRAWRAEKKAIPETGSPTREITPSANSRASSPEA